MTPQDLNDLLNLMPYRKIPLVNDEVYHIFNRGVAKLPIFEGRRDYNRFLNTFYYYQFQEPRPRFSQIKRFKVQNFENNQRIIEVLCYCLMPNHFHFMIKQLKKNGISQFMSKLSNSYTKYFNTIHGRVGPLLQGQFKAVRVESDEQLIHLSRYIHLNPTTSFLVKDLKDHNWSSYLNYINSLDDKLCSKTLLLSMFKSPQTYEQFVLDQQDYAQSLKIIKHKILDD